MILCVRPANERRRYNDVGASLESRLNCVEGCVSDIITNIQSADRLV